MKRAVQYERTVTVYSWKPTMPLKPKVAPEVFGEEMRRLKKQFGHAVQPQALVDAASDPHNPVHNEFEWDDQVCGVEYRLDQARRLIKGLCIHMPTVKHERQVLAPAYINVRTPETDTGRGYEDLETVLDNSDFRTQMIEEALDGLVRSVQKLRLFTELTDTTVRLDDIIAELREMTIRPEPPPSRGRRGRSSGTSPSP